MTPLDPSNLTAYALGELSGPERAAIAAQLAGDPAARQYVADVRATAALLADELARESFGGLTDLQHAALEAEMARPLRISGQTPLSPRARRSVWRDRLIWAMSAAAAVVIVGSIVTVVVPSISRNVNLALAPRNAPAEPLASKSAPPVLLDAAPAMPNLDVKPGSLADAGAAAPDVEGGAPVEAVVPPPDVRMANSGSGREESISGDGRLLVFPARGRDIPTPTVKMTAPHLGSSPTEGVAAVAKPSGKSAQDAFASMSPGNAAPSDAADSTATPGHGDVYTGVVENPFVTTSAQSISGFSAGVDTASYSNVRRFLTHGKLPPPGAVRIEEMLNYFPARPQATGDGPLSMQLEIGACPWRPERRLARVCVQARQLLPVARPPVNLVFVVDNSEAMAKDKSKLPLFKQGMRLLIGRLSSRDHVCIVTVGRESSVVLLPTPVENKAAIWAALDRIDAGGAPVSGPGMDVAYGLAELNFSSAGINRVVLATDGGAFVAGNRPHLLQTVAQRAHEGVTLTVLGMGMTDLKDAALQKLAYAGVGSYAYVDTLAEARKVLVDQMNGALVAMARDVKVQVAFNAAAADSWRLIGYERRVLSKEELVSSSPPGGDMGAGQSVTALYEIIPAAHSSTTRPAEMLTATVTFTDPGSQSPHWLQSSAEDRATPLPRTSTEFRFAAAVAEFGLVLGDSDYKGAATFSDVLDRAQEAAGPDETGYRQEFIGLVRKAKALSALR